MELHFSELPAGLAVSPSHIDSGREAAELVLTAAASAAPGESTVTVTAASDNLADVRPFRLTVSLAAPPPQPVASSRVQPLRPVILRVPPAPQPDPRAAEVRKSSSSGRSVTAGGRTFRAVDLGEGRSAVQCSDRDGRLVWSCPVNGVTRLAMAGSADRVYGITSDQLVCFDAHTGKLIWKVDLRSEGVIVEADPDGSQVFVVTRTELWTISSGTGIVLWRQRGFDKGKLGGAVSLSVDVGKGELVLRFGDGSESRFDTRTGRAIK